MSYAIGWVEYVARLCMDRWSLEPAATVEIIKRVDSLVVPGAVDDDAVSTVLRRSGVAEAEADSVAPLICRAIGA